MYGFTYERPRRPSSTSCSEGCDLVVTHGLVGGQAVAELVEHVAFKHQVIVVRPPLGVLRAPCRRRRTPRGREPTRSGGRCCRRGHRRQARSAYSARPRGRRGTAEIGLLTNSPANHGSHSGDVPTNWRRSALAGAQGSR